MDPAGTTDSDFAIEMIFLGVAIALTVLVATVFAILWIRAARAEEDDDPGRD
jgi:hypothetical protein